MAQLSPDVKMRVATREITLPQALAEAGLEIPEWLRSGSSAPPDATGRARRCRVLGNRRRSAVGGEA